MTTPAANTDRKADGLILGAGPTGLACAGGLSRLLISTLIFSSPTAPFRNAKAPHMHNVLTWDHKDPSLYRAASKKEFLENYPFRRDGDRESGEAAGGRV